LACPQPVSLLSFSISVPCFPRSLSFCPEDGNASCSYTASHPGRQYSVLFEILTVVVMKSSIFWDITLCSPWEINRRFEGICRLQLQGPKKQVRNQL
jgi:hypothetical protein